MPGGLFLCVKNQTLSLGVKGIPMESPILKARLEAKLSLRELAHLVEISAGTLSVWERGLANPKPHDERRILETIRRVATLSRARKEAIGAAREIDLREFVVDIREGRSSACA